MDGSITSKIYMTKSISTRREDTSDSCQNSGWTLYFVDFIASGYDKGEQDDSFFFSDCQSFSSISPSSSSMVSDANWSVMRKRGHGSQHGHRKRKFRASSVDQDLKDTASSPVHSHKVYESNHTKNEQREDNSVTCYQDKRHTSEKKGASINMGIIETELKRKGLCVVPMSMLLNCV